MTKYIIKNCPACHNYLGNIHNCKQMRDTHYELCKDNTLCLLKKIVDKCKNKIDDDICLNCNDFESQKTCYECDYEHHREEIYRKRTDSSFAKDILSMLEIEECEE